MDSPIFFAYLITCAVDGKVYVGITSRTLKQRWAEHLYESRRRRSGMTMAAAIAKHGADKFTIEFLCCSRSWGCICETERQLIAQYSCLAPHGYNLRSGGEGAFGVGRTAESIERSAAKHRGKPCHPNTRAAAIRTHKGKPKSAATRAKMASAKIGKPKSDAAKEKIRAYWADRRVRGEFKTTYPYQHHAKAEA